MLKSIPLPAIAIMVAAACGGDPVITPDNLHSSIICSHDATKNTEGCLTADDLKGYVWDVSGTWTIKSDCSYDYVSAENSNYLGLPCEGAVTLSGQSTTPDGYTTFTYEDVGPSGTGAGFQVYVSSWGTGNDRSFSAFGTDVVQSQGCTSHIDIQFHCGSPDGSGGWICTKMSGVRSSDCANTSGWVHTWGRYSH